MEGTRYFQFLAGERQNEIAIFDKIEEEDGMIFITFKDGSRCNEDLILPLNETKWNNELMAEVESPNNIWKFDVEWVGREEEKRAENADGEMVIVQPFIAGRKKVTPIPPKKTKSNFGTFKTTQPVQIIDEPKEEIKKIKEPSYSDPIYIMLEKAKKFPTNIELDIVVTLPTKSLYGVVKESFENGTEKFIDYIIDNLDIEDIRTSLKESLKESYEEDKNQIGVSSATDLV